MIRVEWIVPRKFEGERATWENYEEYKKRFPDKVLGWEKKKDALDKPKKKKMPVQLLEVAAPVETPPTKKQGEQMESVKKTNVPKKRHADNKKQPVVKKKKGSAKNQ